MTANEVRQPIRAFFQHFFPGRTLEDHGDIFRLGFGNSLFAMQLVEHIETLFRIEIEAEDLDVDNFRSIDAIAALIKRKTVTAKSA